MKRTSVAMLGLAAVVTGWTYATPGESPGPFKLYTHCGVRELNSNGTWYVRAGGPLASEAGTPKGWDDPYQRGWVVIDGNRATFWDSSGRKETFVERPGATKPLAVCSCPSSARCITLPTSCT
ncbi:hypothetical protein [Dermacoccus abyssi]|uniref:hypothetical protein n=1 Tax=Dermacoccus abyssi TaxID=322596 RepID=UPI002AD4D06D|nr:hypothetical protein [Dermacoccus abyssi]